VSPKLAKQIDVELEELHHLLATHQPLVERCRMAPPDAIECSALAAMLHSFYNGVENIFKRIVVETGGSLPADEDWHRQLLDSMTVPSPTRGALLSADLHGRLLGYLGFRHVFRHAYTFRLRWDKMTGLVLFCADVLQALEAAVGDFLRQNSA